MDNFQNKIDGLVDKILNEEINKKVSSVMEQLKGGQSKLDVAKPKGKLTAADFKKLGQKKSSKKEVDESSEEMDEPRKDDNMTDSFLSHLVHHDKPSKPGEKWHDFFTKGPLVDYIKNKKNKRKETDFGMEPLDNTRFDDEEYMNDWQNRFEKWMKNSKTNEKGYPKYHQKNGKMHHGEEMEEGNKFSGELNKARKQHKDSFEVDGEKYNVKESNNLSLTESELVDMIEGIVMEQKKKKEENITVSKLVGKVKDTIGKKYTSGLAKTEKVLAKSKKENDDYISSVTKKMKDYLKRGSEGAYDANPTKFPQGNGENKKDDIKAYQASDAVDEYIEAFAYPGMTNLVYDEIKPEDDKIDMYLKGNSKTGNAVVDKDGKPLGNVVPSKVGDRFKKNYDDNLYGAEQMEVSYKRYPQPVDMAGEKKGSGTLKSKASKAQKVMDKVEESEIKKEKIISEDMNKMKNLISYNRKTQ